MHTKTIEVLKETENYKITLVKRFWFENQAKTLEQLEVKINGNWVLVKYYLHQKDWEEHSEALSVAESFSPTRGYFRVDGQGHPLDHFDKEFNYDFGQGQIHKVTDWELEDVSFSRLKHHTQFSGSHKWIGAVFYYIIWDETLAADIEKKFKTRR